MKFKLKKNQIKTLLAIASSVANKKHSLPILSNVMIIAGEDSVSIYATDLNVFIGGTIKADAESAGSVCVKADVMNKIIKNMGKDDIYFKVKGNNLIVSSGKSKFKLSILPVDDYPNLPNISECEFIELKSELLNTMIDKTLFASSCDETRVHLNGCLFEMGDGVARMVSTDGHRLAKYEKCGEFNTEASFIIQRKGILELNKILDNEGKVEFARDFHHNLYFKRTQDGIDYFVSIKPIDEKFPPYDQVIPKSSEHTIDIAAKDMIESLKRLIVVSDESKLGVKLEISNGEIKASTQNDAVGQGEDVLTTDYEGDDICIMVNVKYLIEALEASDDDTVLEISGELDPLVIRNQDSTFLGVVMPMRM